MASACHCVLGFHSTAVNKAVYSVVYFNTTYTPYTIEYSADCVVHNLDMARVVLICTLPLCSSVTTANRKTEGKDSKMTIYHTLTKCLPHC